MAGRSPTGGRVRRVAEPARRTPVRDEVDVLVVGGGLAGVSAAVAAARTGARTLLIERNGFPGGVATAGMCCSVFNCFYNASHELLVKGNALEFVEALARNKRSGPAWQRHRGHIIFDVERAKLILTGLLEDAGARYLFDTVSSDVLMSRNRIRGVLVESKAGREAIKAKVVVDATGDADIACRAGAPMHTASEAGWAKHSYCFRIGNVDVDKFVQYFVDHPKQYPPYMDVDWALKDAVRQYRETGTFLFPHGGGIQMKLIKKGIAKGQYKTELGVHDNLAALQMHAIRDLGVVHVITGFCKLPDNLDPAAISRAITDGKRMAFHVTDFFRKHIPGFKKACVIVTADDLGIRGSRWIKGDFVFTKEMRQNPVRFDDAIGRGVVQRNYVRNKARGAWSVQTFTDDSFDIPYRCLLPRKVEGLLMGSGRSVSAENPFLLRVMALTMVIGQAAGVAAATSVKQSVTPRRADIRKIQRALKRQGVALR